MLLLEAGGEDKHPFQMMPLAFLKVGESKTYNWMYETEPEPHMNGRRIPIGRGKGLGGSSSINALINMRGHRRDYDRWKEAGLEGWGYADVLPYFKRAETDWRGEGPYHGGSGPIHMSPMDFPDMLFDRMRTAAQAAGVPYSEDANGAQQEGISRMDGTIGEGMRSSTARCYLRPAIGRRNLTVRTHALTHRVIVEQGRAVGVAYAWNGKLVESRAQREVILSAGAVATRSVAMAPEAPGRFSTTICCPNASASFGAAWRTVTSAMPPGEKPTTMRMGLAG